MTRVTEGKCSSMESNGFFQVRQVALLLKSFVETVRKVVEQ